MSVETQGPWKPKAYDRRPSSAGAPVSDALYFLRCGYS